MSRRPGSAAFLSGLYIASQSLISLNITNNKSVSILNNYQCAMLTSIQIWERAPNVTWLYVTVLSILGAYAVYSQRQRLRILKLMFSLDGPPSIPIVGNAGLAYDDDLLGKMSHKVYEMYGPIFRVWLTLLPCVVLLEPEHIQLVLGNSKNTGKIVFYKMLDNFIGKGLITSNVETWAKHRKIIQPAFHLQYLERFAMSFARCSDRLARKLAVLGARDIDVTSFVNDSVYEILNETVLGVKVGEDEAMSDGSEELPFRKGKMVVPYRLTRPWLLIDTIYGLTSTGKNEQKHRDDLANACQRIISHKRETMSRTDSSTKKELNTLVDFMIERSGNNAGLTDKEIVNECSTFMLAGQDSVGTATAMTLFLLANNSEWLDKCRAENDEIFGAPKTTDEYRPRISDFRAMKYLEWCIKEALRLYPSVPFFARTLGEDVKIGKHVLPKGCGVLVMPYSTHRLPHHFSDPHSFRPERFSPENSVNRHPYSYLPFSAGPRNCIGYKFAMLEIKSMISAILRKFVITPVHGKEEVRPKFRLTVRAKGGLWIKIAPRAD